MAVEHANNPKSAKKTGTPPSTPDRSKKASTTNERMSTIERRENREKETRRAKIMQGVTTMKIRGGKIVKVSRAAELKLMKAKLKLMKAKREWMEQQLYRNRRRIFNKLTIPKLHLTPQPRKLKHKVPDLQSWIYCEEYAPDDNTADERRAIPFPEYPAFSGESIPKGHKVEKSSAANDYKGSDMAFIHDEEKGTMTFVGRTELQVTPEQIEAAGGMENIPQLEILPQLPSWFPDHIKAILESDACPDDLTLTDILELTEYHGFLAKAQRHRWRTYVDVRRTEAYYSLRLETYRSRPVPTPIIKDCKRRLKIQERNGLAAMINLDNVVQGKMYLDRVMACVYRSEREVYDDLLPPTLWEG